MNFSPLREQDPGMVLMKGTTKHRRCHIINRNRANRLLQHSYKQSVFAEGRITQVLNIDYSPSIWSWEVKLTNGSCETHRIPTHLVKRAYKLQKGMLRESILPQYGDRVILECRLTGINHKFKPEHARIMAIIK